MNSIYRYPHVVISGRHKSYQYVAPKRNLADRRQPRNAQEHGVRLLEQLQRAYRKFTASRPQDTRIPTADGNTGLFLEVDLLDGTEVASLERKKAGIATGAVTEQTNGNLTIGVFVPERSATTLQTYFTEYAELLTPSTKNPRHKRFVESIEDIKAATFQTFYTDKWENLPCDPKQQVWWEIWCRRSVISELERMVISMDARIANNDRWVQFHETTIVPVFASQQVIELILFAQFSITEIRLANDSPTVFLESSRQEQFEWTEDLAERTVWPDADAPTVCVLDTGVNRSHRLLEHAVEDTDLSTVESSWGVDDTGPEQGHGTLMAGISLHGDLVAPLASTEKHVLRHRLESVKILPPHGTTPNEERFYASITQAGITMPEKSFGTRRRVFCMAATNDGVNGEQPSAWSASIDQMAMGSRLGQEEGPRLIILATGNAPSEMDATQIKPCEEQPIEDPAQAWNGITVGGYTDKVSIDEENLNEHLPLAKSGELSPHTRTSARWNRNAPVKPDIVMEAGNRAIDPLQENVVSTESLGLLSTGAAVDRQPLVSFSGTSAAAAAAARLAARLMEKYPDFWPETIRALIVHGAEWTDAMQAKLDTSNRTSKAAYRRWFGYGVPTYERSSSSASNHLALIAQTNIQPFSNKRRGFEECHYYSLPWPVDAIRRLGEEPIELKVTLSYFIDPNPSFSAAVNPQRYRSHGLRFDLKRQFETRQHFHNRVNQAEREEEIENKDVAERNNWLFGYQSISSGSLHCDIWKGSAVDLLTHDEMCVYPVGGWWNSRANQEVRSTKTRYALALSLKTRNVEVDLYSAVKSYLQVDVPIGESVQ